MKHLVERVLENELLRGVLLLAVGLVIFWLIFAWIVPAKAGGFPTITLTHTSSSVTSTSSITVAANLNRSWLWLSNEVASAIYCKFNVAAVVGEGIRVNASGGTFEISAAKGNLDVRELRCITSEAAAQTLEVTEGE